MSQNNPSFFRSLRFRYGAALLIFLTVGGFFLLQEHKVHVLGYLPLILLLGLCGGMHFFMHGGHGHDGHGKTPGDTDSSDVDREDFKK